MWEVSYCWFLEIKRADEKKYMFNCEELFMTDKRKSYEKKFDAQLKEWSAEIALLNSKADKAKAEEKIEYYKMIETLQGKQDAARIKLQELRTAGDDAWADLKAATENVWTEVKTAFQGAASRFK
ncbi:MAG: coiled coil domain-containing protein [Proteobacteria bacterium]|nr:coiled coil domain-containing protein [Pseudomonadota bacterium]